MDNTTWNGSSVPARLVTGLCWTLLGIGAAIPAGRSARAEAFDAATRPVEAVRAADIGDPSILVPGGAGPGFEAGAGDLVVDTPPREITVGDLPEARDPMVDGMAPVGMAAADEACFGDAACEPCIRCPRWEAQVDALLLWQGNIPSRPLFVDPSSGAVGLDANQAQPPLSAGPRYGLLYHVDATRAIEGNYFIVRSFSGQATLPPGNYYENGLAGSTFGPVDAAQLLTSGNIQSAELNWRRCSSGTLTWISGFRWVEWNQQMQIDETTSPPYAFTSRTGNDLYGGQVGVDLCLWNDGNGPFTVDALAKTGLYYNHAFQRTGAGEPGGATPPTVAAAVTDQVSCFSEVGVTGHLRLCSWLSWRAGYTLFWLNGIATPAAQLSATNLASLPPTATINTGGSVLLHGVTTGLEARW